MSSSINPSQAAPQSYLDFEGLSKLKGQARQKSKEATIQTAQQFEALFLQMMMKSMRDSIDKSDVFGKPDSARDTFESMFDKEISVQMAKRNSLGLADFLVKGIEAQAAHTSTADMLATHTANQPKPIALTLPAKSVSLKKDSSPGIALPKQMILPFPKGQAMKFGDKS